MDSKPEDAVSHFGDADNKKDHEVDGSTEMKIDIANTDLVAPLGAAKKPNPRSCSLSQLWIITRRRFGKGRGYLRMDLFLPLVFYVFFVFWDCFEFLFIYFFFVESKGGTLEELDAVLEAPNPKEASTAKLPIRNFRAPEEKGHEHEDIQQV